jgi:D-alanyl-lipoteichoic acid acyltransferase DltB (MBOAT superfamily)
MDWLYSIIPFQRLHGIFSGEVGDGSSLVFTKLDFWIFFLFATIGLSIVISKRKWVSKTVGFICGILFFKVMLAVMAFSKKGRELVRNIFRGNEQLLMRSIFLTLVSVFFFYKTSGLYVLLLAVSIIVNYVLGKRIYKARSNLRSKWIITFSAIFNLLILFYFKYAYFFTDSFNEMFNTQFELVNHFAQFGNSFFGEGTFVDKILLPVGVSFFTFQNISYVVDIYRKEITPVKNFFHYSFFVTFFPQLVMGPIVRARDFIPQITQYQQLDKKDFSWSVIQIVKGLVKKIVIADFLVVHFIDKIVFTPELFPGFVSVLAMWAYSLHIYADFSGYTDIAIGLSRLMGFKLKKNFNSPYKAKNVADFWRRWHISLGSWLKDYLYIPLGGNRTGSIGSYIAIFFIFVFLIFITQWYELLYVYGGLTVVYIIGLTTIKDFKRYVHRDLNLIITMVVGGLWHGPSENFVIWGAMNGCALLVYKYWSKISFYEKSKLWIVSFWKVFLTFNFITFTRIWFKLDEARTSDLKGGGMTDAEADDLPFKMLDRIWNHFDFSWEVFVTVLETYQAVFWIMLGGYIIHWLPEKVKKIWETAYTALPIPLQAIAVAIIVFLMYQAIGAEQPPFVYLQF